MQRDKVQGTVKNFDVRKGWGMINVGGSDDVIFVHHSALLQDGFRKLQDGEDVEFDIETDGVKRSAPNVTQLNPRVAPPGGGD